MARSELRMAFAHGEVLRRLNEAPGALGIFFKIHSHPSSEPPALLEAQADPAMSDLLMGGIRQHRTQKWTPLLGSIRCLS